MVQLQKLPSSCRPYYIPLLFEPLLFPHPFVASSASGCHVFSHYQLQHFLCHCRLDFCVARMTAPGSQLLDGGGVAVAFSCTLFTFSLAHLIMSAILICMLPRSQIFVVHMENKGS